jgi:outer membrane protein assembly factor BamB
VDLGTGRRSWLTLLPKNNQVPKPVIVGSTVLVNAGSSVYALDRQDGQVLWRFTMADVLSGPVVEGAFAYVGAANAGTIYGLDLASGSTTWARPLDSNIVSIASGGDHLLALTYGGSVYALDRMSGGIVWTAHVDDAVVDSMPLVTGDAAFVIGRPQLRPGLAGLALHAIDLRSHRERWTVVRPDLNGAYLSASAEVVAIGGNEGVGESGLIYGLDASTGRELWRSPLASAPPRVDGGEVFAAGGPSGDERIALLDAGTGNEAWSDAYAGTTWAAVEMTDRAVFLGLDQGATGEVVCIDRSDGEVIWRASAPLPIQSTPVMVGDTLFVVASET